MDYPRASGSSTRGSQARGTRLYRELKQATFLTTRTSTGSKFDVISQSRFLAESFDVTLAVRVVKNVGCLSSLIPHNTTYFDPTILVYKSPTVFYNSQSILLGYNNTLGDLRKAYFCIVILAINLLYN